MYLIVTDEAGKTGQAQLTVDVNRNLFAPVMQPPLTVNRNISSSLSPGTSIATVRATGRLVQTMQNGILMEKFTKVAIRKKLFPDGESNPGHGGESAGS